MSDPLGWAFLKPMLERWAVHVDTDICSPEITYNFGFSELLA